MDTVYLTPAEWQDMATGINFTNLTDSDQEALIRRASRNAESYANLYNGSSWCVTSYTNEKHKWRASRAAYLHNWPLVSIDAARLRIGPRISTTLSVDDIYVNEDERYVEVSELTLALGVTPDIMALGMSEPVMEVDYTAGYEIIPEDIKIAVAIIASAALVSKQLFEENTVGVISYTIGSYMVSFGNKQVGGLAGFSNYVPDEAKDLLKSYKRIVLR